MFSRNTLKTLVCSMTSLKVRQTAGKTKGSMMRTEHRIGVCKFAGVELAFPGEGVPFGIL